MDSMTGLSDQSGDIYFCFSTSHQEGDDFNLLLTSFMYSRYSPAIS